MLRFHVVNHARYNATMSLYSVGLLDIVRYECRVGVVKYL